MLRVEKSIVVAAVLAGVIGVAGCAGRDSAAAPAGAAADAAAVVASIPAGSSLAKVTKGMTDTDVRKALGEPTSSRSYMTGKQFIPWYFGSDTSRTAWTYAGKGVVVFTRNRYSQGLKVIEVKADPSAK